MPRDRLPDRRNCTNTTFKFKDMVIDAQCGYYDDGRIAEIFMTTRKFGSTLDVLIRDTALTVSIALQYGATLEELAHSATRKEDGTDDGLISVMATHILSNKLDMF